MSRYQNSCRFVQSLGLKYPIIQAPMAGVSTVQLAATITNHGGLGSIPLGGVDFTTTVGPIEDLLKSFQSLVPNPDLHRNVNLNFFYHEYKSDPSCGETPPQKRKVENWVSLVNKSLLGPDRISGDLVSEITTTSRSLLAARSKHKMEAAVLALLAHYQPKVVSFHFGCPEKEFIGKLQGLGIAVHVCATTLAEVDVLLNAGVDAILCQGDEAGGHRGSFDLSNGTENLSTFALTQLVLGKVNGLRLQNPPVVIAAGGIMDGTVIESLLSLGAGGVMMGTAFLRTPESIVSRTFSKQVEGLYTDTIITPLVSGRPARCLKTLFVSSLEREYANLSDKEKGLPDYVYRYVMYKKILAHLPNQDGRYGLHLTGQGYPFIRSGLNAQQVFGELTEELEARGWKLGVDSINELPKVQ
ncbi:hypothetical protein BABINDRAFT_161866 [Babjeviella inositovora NRRL Y-12698]|uniref:Uncharacterized protein n=1 Tax=Babjeviella inositovora NRRL Y-12698 TaxID=984486 RepID=A0A1E3QP74_9ASCO|nr:uncharacterized protein BABINDRAFT_161866 [Babjeviella inositovora NRRL Y-12698]ODQ79471.1 hypothetical protein BABINDRAFT_161866 [Babjeviella inositovora NRRL Y-12698]